MTDLELLQRFRSGDEAAFHELVNRHADYLYGVACCLCGNSADAEDVVQETFAGAFKGAAGFRGASSVKTWLTRILVRQVARIRRDNWKRKVFPIGDGLEQIVDSDSSLAVLPAQREVDDRMDVMAMLQELSAEHREVIVLRELQGMSYGEIAESLGVPQGTVESRLHRARQELRQRFKDYL